MLECVLESEEYRELPQRLCCIGSDQLYLFLLAVVRGDSTHLTFLNHTEDTIIEWVESLCEEWSHPLNFPHYNHH